MLKGKKIIIGVTGSIAAYKTASIIRLLVKKGAEVKVIMTPIAKQFISPLTLATLSKNPIMVDFFNPENGAWNSHVNMGIWADLYLIAPASANTIAKMANGVADNLLLTTYLSAKCPVMVAPAMDLDMYKHRATQKNLETILSYGNIIIEPESGELASGLEGKGRMSEPENIVSEIEKVFAKKYLFAGKNILITLGPTYEKLDPVRFIGNYSSGKMGASIANSFHREGANVTAIAGPALGINIDEGVNRIDVESAKEMYEAVLSKCDDNDIIIMCAAVADYTPQVKSDFKLKREGENIQITLSPTQDIAKAVGEKKTDKQILVGFALETNDEFNNALCKMERKNLDMIILNSLNDKGAGFMHSTNKVTIIKKDKEVIDLPLMNKEAVADVILDVIYNI